VGQKKCGRGTGEGSASGQQVKRALRGLWMGSGVPAPSIHRAGIRRGTGGGYWARKSGEARVRAAQAGAGALWMGGGAAALLVHCASTCRGARGGFGAGKTGGCTGNSGTSGWWAKEGAGGL
jgi:hypothetical protein